MNTNNSQNWPRVDTSQGNYTIFPNHVLDLDLSPEELRLYIHYRRWSFPGAETAWKELGRSGHPLSAESIMAYCGMSKSTLSITRRALADGCEYKNGSGKVIKLKGRGLIRLDRVGLSRDGSDPERAYYLHVTIVPAPGDFGYVAPEADTQSTGEGGCSTGERGCSTGERGCSTGERGCSTGDNMKILERLEILKDVSPAASAPESEHNSEVESGHNSEADESANGAHTPLKQTGGGEAEAASENKKGVVPAPAPLNPIEHAMNIKASREASPDKLTNWDFTRAEIDALLSGTGNERSARAKREIERCKALIVNAVNSVGLKTSPKTLDVLKIIATDPKPETVTRVVMRDAAAALTRLPDLAWYQSEIAVQAMMIAKSRHEAARASSDDPAHKPARKPVTYREVTVISTGMCYAVPTDEFDAFVEANGGRSNVRTN